MPIPLSKRPLTACKADTSESALAGGTSIVTGCALAHQRTHAVTDACLQQNSLLPTAMTVARVSGLVPGHVKSDDVAAQIGISGACSIRTSDDGFDLSDICGCPDLNPIFLRTYQIFLI